MDANASVIIRRHFAVGGPWALDAGSRVAAARGTMSGSDLARLARMSQSTISRIERGALVPSESVRAALALSLEQDIATLFPCLSLADLREIAGVS